MFARNIRIPRTAIAFALAAGLTFGAIPPASAQTGVTVTGTANATLTGLTIPATLTAVTLDGTNKTATGALSTFTVTDGRGTGAGWKVTTTATPFQIGTDVIGLCQSQYQTPSRPPSSTKVSGSDAA